MNRISRLLVLIASIVALGAYAFPLWRIRLVAPQYPEGLGMLIRINTVTGTGEFDLANINKLNHYIGMKAISPDIIPELKYMPWLLGALVVMGVIVAIAGKRRLLYAWLVAFTVLGVAGLADFWRWGYDYGHNLDREIAVIEVPGMTYQPPLIGSKQLLNFRATSWPASGSFFLGASVALGVLALLIDYRRSRTRIPDDQPEMSERAVRGLGASAALAAMLTLGSLHAAPAGAQPTLVVSPNGPFRTLGSAILAADSGARIVVKPGTYREPMIVVNKPLVIVGENYPVLDGEGARQIMVVSANGVTIRGLRFLHVGVSHVEDRAALRLVDVRDCRVENNQVDDALFGIYLAKVSQCSITDNVIRGRAKTEANSGNGIHLWSSQEITIAGNQVSGHRDGIYFEFVHDSRITRNLSEGNLRYGLHFMYSDDCVYEANTFRRNGAGVAVMYTNRVHMIGNRFEDNWGSSAYGLLLKEIRDSELKGNRFSRNTVGVVADGANRLVATRNEFVGNGWGIRLDASTDDAEITDNNFLGNTFDVSTNSRESSATLRGNYFDEYRGYDLDRDGIGDVPHRPVRLFSILVARNTPAMILLRSLFVTVLDVAERAIPSLTPGLLSDTRPAMRRIQ